MEISPAPKDGAKAFSGTKNDPRKTPKPQGELTTRTAGDNEKVGETLGRYMHLHDNQGAMTRGRPRHQISKSIARDMKQTRSATQGGKANTRILTSTTESSTRGGTWMNGLEEAKPVKQMTERMLVDTAIE